MHLRSVIICSYLMVAYWASSHFASLEMVFYPTLGAFSFLFLQRMDKFNDIKRIIIGAVIAVTIGNLFYMFDSGALSFFATAIVTISLIHYFKWNAAPILAVSLIPYFAHPVSMWTMPVAVIVSLLGLLLPLWLITRFESLKKGSLSIGLFRGKTVESQQEG
ncbi:HPP family protein [Paenibacillus oenotherae]|uniref:HPP family protein n=1 Tax=Paenibacillus oenotherae TaxID=1435645 RepID=A0ABS7D5W8_9BACL|nr:HPP family protein [Paenibacillus oenotherae]MBW7475226.1 HPP family protein [Paenibacillus oenotherae]